MCFGKGYNMLNLRLPAISEQGTVVRRPPTTKVQGNQGFHVLVVWVVTTIVLRAAVFLGYHETSPHLHTVAERNPGYH